MSLRCDLIRAIERRVAFLARHVDALRRNFGGCNRSSSSVLTSLRRFGGIIQMFGQKSNRKVRHRVKYLGNLHESIIHVMLFRASDVQFENLFLHAYEGALHGELFRGYTVNNLICIYIYL